MEPGISSLLGAAERGDASAADVLFAALYSELHRLARRELARHGAPMSLSATTLLHKAYLDMAGQSGPTFPDRARFMSYAARVMRGLIIDYVGSRRARKRGGEQLKRVLELCDAVDAEFVAGVAIYCRTYSFMKDMPALLCAWLSARDARLHEAVFARVIDNTRMLRTYVQILRSGVVGRKSLGSAPKRLAREWLASRNKDALFSSQCRPESVAFGHL